MSKRVLYLIVLIAAAVLLGGGYFYMSAERSNLPNEIAATTTISVVATTSSATTTYDKYAESVVEKVVEKETSVPVKAVAEKPTPKNVAGKKWVLAVSVNSLNSDLALTESPGETPWMDQVRFDSELTAFEQKAKADLPQTTANWQAIIGRDDLAQQMVSEIQNTYAPIWQKKLDDLIKIQNAGNGVTTLFISRWGPNISDVPAKYRDTAQYNLDLNSVVADDIHLAELNLQIKQQTIKAVQNKNVDAAVTAANDEDRITLVASWYDERVAALMKRNDEISQTLTEMIAEYPRQ